MNTPRFIVDKEFEILRAEINQGKKYVFERIILIITGSAVTLFQLVDKTYALYLPVLIIAILLFNLWFTANRLKSMARIIAYVQLVLENKESNWFGWETSLRYYRIWKNQFPEKVSYVKNEIKKDRKITYDNLGFYPTIYFIHVLSSVTVALGSITYFIILGSNLAISMSILTAVLLVIFILYARSVRPNKDVLPLIEINRWIWKEVLTFDWENFERKENELLQNKLDNL